MAGEGQAPTHLNRVNTRELVLKMALQDRAKNLGPNWSKRIDALTH